MFWSKLFPRILKVAHVTKWSPRQEEEKDILWKLYDKSDSISYRTVILDRLLLLRLRYFESEIAKSEQYPHEVNWGDFGDEMFELLAICERQLNHIITTSKVMEEFLKPDHVKELRELEKYRKQLNEK